MPDSISRGRERRFLALIEGGATIAEACRAVEISRPTVYRRVRDDAAFASRLDIARADRSGPPVDDWRAAAAILESNFPERWSLPGDLGDPFDAFDFDGGAEIGWGNEREVTRCVTIARETGLASRLRRVREPAP